MIDAIEGHVAPGFDAVAHAFRENFRQRGEWGAAVAAYRGDTCLVDLWGGIADRATGMPWRRDTVVLAYSTTKGVAAMTMAHAHSRALFDHDHLVKHYWPEFAQADKSGTTVGELLSHQAGLAVIDAPWSPAVLADPKRRDAVLAAQRPLWKSGDYHGYHATSFGFYAAALLRRCDPKGRGVARYFEEELARPLDLKFWMGLPHDFDSTRLARTAFRPPWSLAPLRRLNLSQLWNSLRPGSLSRRSIMNPRILRLREFESAPYCHLEHPSTIGIGEVRAVARLYAEFASGAKRLQIAPHSLAALETPLMPRRGLHDLVMGMEMTYGMGVTKPRRNFRFGSSDRAYGTAGFGGSFGCADPDLGIGYAYVPNRLGMYMSGDPREHAVRVALYECLRRSDGQRSL